MAMNDSISLDDIVSIRTLVKRHPTIGTEASLRWQIHRAKHNGLAESGAIIRRGRILFIVVPRYLAWMLGESRRDYHKT